MASRIAALQAKLGGGAGIMGGMRPGGMHPGLRKKQQEKKQRRASLDNSALLDRTVVKGQRKRKKINIDFDELEDEKQDAETFTQLISAQPVSSETANAEDSGAGANDSLSASASLSAAASTGQNKRITTGGMNMKAMLAGSNAAGGFKRKKGVKMAAQTPTPHKDGDNDQLPNRPFLQARNRTKSKSFTLGVTFQGLLSADEVAQLKAGDKKMVADGDGGQILEIVSKKHGKRHVRLFVELDKYIACRAAEPDGNGLQIESFRDNEYGASMQEKGLKRGWRLTKIDKLEVAALTLAGIKEKVAAHMTAGGSGGYNITFEGDHGGGGAKTPTMQASKNVTPSLTPAKDVFADAQKSASSSSSLKSELVKEELGSKVVRLFDVYEKYFTAGKGKDGKGLVIESVVDEGFTEHGVGVGWQLQKLGKRNVSKTSFIMLRNQLMAQASTAKKFGYELTFIDTESKKSSSQPSSPRGGGASRTAPSTAPFKPMPSPTSNVTATSLSSKTPKTPTLTSTSKSPTPKTQSQPAAKTISSSSSSSTATPFKITPKKKLPTNAAAKIPTKALPGLATASAISTTTTTTNSSNGNGTKATKSSKQSVPDEDDIAKQKFKKNRKSSYEAPKTCDLVEDGANKKEVRLFQEYSKFFTAKAGDGNKGFVVNTITNNEFGSAFKNMGIPGGWRVTRCAGKPIGNKMFVMLQSQVSSAGKSQDAQKNGYMVMFESAAANNEEQKTNATSNNKAAATTVKPRNVSSSSSRPKCELLNDDDGGNSKTIRLYHSIEKYVKSAAEKGPKGYKIIEFSKMFGADLQALGVQVEWKLTKLGAKDVSKAFFQMTKTNLDVEFRNNKNKGYVVTFSAP
eukprot:CAMPEP_0202687948 /NCGR_PEP_ID=MMETSP1385-20130828/3495_1 /ASSEMBLY_ACC=CAM_ASM_000861 /TAXON_ID=933848 /ORGANISM="Elphidium margaritaceum" /LENGTH=854 /DNA_ID=CAMNT_0049342813 /DNA_START=110 /DNA_END=2674 /DNA_ORIENTATION=-